MPATMQNASLIGGVGGGAIADGRKNGGDSQAALRLERGCLAARFCFRENTT